MKNLKGSDFNRQINDGLIKLDARGTKKFPSSNYTHSRELYIQREALLSDLADFLVQQGIKGKINMQLDENKMSNYLNTKLDSWSNRTIKSRLSTLSSLFSGLKDVGIRTSLETSYFQTMKSTLKSRVVKQEKETRYINEKQMEKLLKSVNTKSEAYGLYLQILIETGFRDKEAMRLLSNSEKWLVKDKSNFIIHKMFGKGNKIYADKQISEDLYTKLKQFNADNVPSYSSFYRSLGDNSAHDLRFSYAKNRMDTLLNQGVQYRKALKIVSAELNHKREEITRYYLART